MLHSDLSVIRRASAVHVRLLGRIPDGAVLESAVVGAEDLMDRNKHDGVTVRIGYDGPRGIVPLGAWEPGVGFLKLATDGTIIDAGGRADAHGRKVESVLRGRLTAIGIDVRPA